MGLGSTEQRSTLAPHSKPAQKPSSLAQRNHSLARSRSWDRHDDDEDRRRPSCMKAGWQERRRRKGNKRATWCRTPWREKKGERRERRATGGSAGSRSSHDSNQNWPLDRNCQKIPIGKTYLGRVPKAQALPSKGFVSIVPGGGALQRCGASHSNLNRSDSSIAAGHGRKMYATSLEISVSQPIAANTAPRPPKIMRKSQRSTKLSICASAGSSAL